MLLAVQYTQTHTLLTNVLFLQLAEIKRNKLPEEMSGPKTWTEFKIKQE